MNQSANRVLGGAASVFWPLLMACASLASAAEPEMKGNAMQEDACMPQDCDLFKVDDRILAVLPYPQRFYPSGADETGATMWSEHDAQNVSHDHEQEFAIGENPHWLKVLSDMDSFNLKTLWEDQGNRLFLGIDKHGFAGLMFGQKDHDAGSNSASHDGKSYENNVSGPLQRPLLHWQSLNYEQPDLSHETETTDD